MECSSESWPQAIYDFPTHALLNIHIPSVASQNVDRFKSRAAARMHPPAEEAILRAAVSSRPALPTNMPDAIHDSGYKAMWATYACVVSLANLAAQARKFALSAEEASRQYRWSRRRLLGQHDGAQERATRALPSTW